MTSGSAVAEERFRGRRNKHTFIPEMSPGELCDARIHLADLLSGRPPVQIGPTMVNRSPELLFYLAEQTGLDQATILRKLINAGIGHEFAETELTKVFRIVFLPVMPDEDPHGIAVIHSLRLYRTQARNPKLGIRCATCGPLLDRSHLVESEQEDKAREAGRAHLRHWYAQAANTSYKNWLIM